MNSVHNYKSSENVPTILTVFSMSTEMRSLLSLLCLADCIVKIFKKLKGYFGLVKQTSTTGIDSKTKISCIWKSFNYFRVTVNLTRDFFVWGIDHLAVCYQTRLKGKRVNIP